jgi:hypothetical protein
MVMCRLSAYSWSLAVDDMHWTRLVMTSVPAAPAPPYERGFQRRQHMLSEGHD